MVNIVNPVHNIPEDIVKKYYFSEFIFQMKSEWLTPDTMKFYNMRNYVMIEVMVYTGMRRKEVANLRIEDYKKDHIIIREGKWQKDRMIPLPKKTQDTMNGWLQIRKDLPGETVFCTSDGWELQSRAISDVFKRISRTLGMNVHLHSWDTHMPLYA